MVIRKYKGLTIRSEWCPNCHVSLEVSRVSYAKLYWLPDRLEIEKRKAIERAGRERTGDGAIAVLKWQDKYLVLPETIARKSPYEWVFACDERITVVKQEDSSA